MTMRVIRAGQLAQQIMSVICVAKADVCGGVSDVVHVETDRTILDAFHARFLSLLATDHNGGLIVVRDGR